MPELTTFPGVSCSHICACPLRAAELRYWECDLGFKVFLKIKVQSVRTNLGVGFGVDDFKDYKDNIANASGFYATLHGGLLLSFVLDGVWSKILRS